MTNSPQELITQCSGALFSTLIFELLKYGKPQEGFLLGEIQKVTSSSISDSQICNETTKLIINVTAFVPCTSTANFYSGGGNVNEKLLKLCVGDDLGKVVGWYRNRRSCHENFFRETRVLKQLQSKLPHMQDNLILALISAFLPTKSGTVDLTYKFQVLRNNLEYEGVSLKVINMTDSSSSHYIRDAPSSALYNSATLENIFKHMSLEPGVAEATKLHTGLLDKLKESLPKYSKVQEKHFKMTQELLKLRALCHSSGILSEYIEKGGEHVSPIFQTRSRKLNENKSADVDGLSNSQDCKSTNEEVSITLDVKSDDKINSTEGKEVDGKKKKKISKSNSSKTGSINRTCSPKATKLRNRQTSLGKNGNSCSPPKDTNIQHKVLKQKDSTGNKEEKIKTRNDIKQKVYLCNENKGIKVQTAENLIGDGNISPEI